MFLRREEELIEKKWYILFIRFTTTKKEERRVFHDTETIALSDKTTLFIFHALLWCRVSGSKAE